jgi:hypothetical protein
LARPISPVMNSRSRVSTMLRLRCDAGIWSSSASASDQRFCSL